MYQPRTPKLLTHVNNDRSRKRGVGGQHPAAEDLHAASAGAALDLAMAVLAEDALAQEQGVLGHPEHLDAGVRTAVALRGTQEVGAWALEYIGPGFHVQLRIARRGREARLDGWMSPARPIRVVLSSLVHHTAALETRISESGRFEFVGVPTGACRMSFLLGNDRAPCTPPFWI